MTYKRKRKKQIMIVELAKEKQNDNDELAGVNICNKFYEVIIEFY